jgi:hypothetical protein
MIGGGDARALTTLGISNDKARALRQSPAEILKMG